jgi:hypothetical protein
MRPNGRLAPGKPDIFYAQASGGFHYTLYLFVTQDVVMGEVLHSAGVAVNAPKVTAVGDRDTHVVYVAMIAVKQALGHNAVYCSIKYPGALYLV